LTGQKQLRSIMRHWSPRCPPYYLPEQVPYILADLPCRAGPIYTHRLTFPSRAHIYSQTYLAEQGPYILADLPCRAGPIYTRRLTFPSRSHIYSQTYLPEQVPYILADLPSRAGPIYTRRLTLPSRSHIYSQIWGQIGDSTIACTSMKVITRSLCMSPPVSSLYLSRAACSSKKPAFRASLNSILS